jgi:hypothetical protein
MRLIHTEEVRPGVYVEAHLLSGENIWALRAYSYGPRNREVPAIASVPECRDVLATAQRLERERQADELRGGRV